MLAGAHTRRRGAGFATRDLLVERATEIAALEECLAAARYGHGQTVLIEAPAGSGKSSLLAVARDVGRETGMQVLSAAGNELEREFAFGVAIQLFEPRRASAGAGAWTELLSGPAELVRELLETGNPDAGRVPGRSEYSMIHGLFWLISNLAFPAFDSSTSAPLVVLVDDLHAADRSSLRFLSYLAERISDLPVALVLAVSPGTTNADPRALAALRDAQTVQPLRPASLHDQGIEILVRAEFPDADPDFVAACGQVTIGNPFLLVELLQQLHADGQPPDQTTAVKLRGLAPEAIVNAVIARLGGLSAAARALASAVSVLGDGSSLAHAAQLANLGVSEAEDAADALAAVHIFQPGVPLSFAHPMVRSAVAASMPPMVLGRSHRRAATILGDAGTAPEIVAGHLLVAPPETEPGAVADLRAAAKKVLAGDAPESAIRFLKRALSEQPEPPTRSEVLAELAQAEAVAGLPEAEKHLLVAIGVTEDPARRAELSIAQSRLLYTQGRYRDAAAALEQALGVQLGDECLTREVGAAYLRSASLVPELSETVAAHRRRLLDGLRGEPTAGERLALAHVAAHAAMRGEPRAEVRRLADLAWGNGALLNAEEAECQGWEFLTAALFFSDELEREVEICDAALAIARERHSPLLYATANYCRTWPLYEQGSIARSTGDAEAALTAQPHGWRTHFRPAAGALACCQLQQGQLDQVEPALESLEDPDAKGRIAFPFMLDVRAQLRLAQHRPQDALDDATLAGACLAKDFAVANPAVIAWRSTAALAQLALGDPQHAEALARQELDQARQIGVTRLVIRGRRLQGLISGGKQGIELLEQAVNAGRDYPRRLDHVSALIDFGAALRRANRRVDARRPLREALELCQQGGAAALRQRAQAELVAAGARPRRTMLSGVASLTPSELRVADLAGRGLTTKRIAEALFVSPKTVEFHIRHIYQKLDINSREELVDRVGPPAQ